MNLTIIQVVVYVCLFGRILLCSLSWPEQAGYVVSSPPSSAF